MSNNNKQQRYLEISRQITEQVGGKENIVASTHCATRLHIVLKDYDKINKEAIDNIDLVKGEFVAGNQLQIIFGAGLGYLALNWKNNKAKELCIPSFISTLFGISEPAIFGVNLRYKFPLVAGCIGGAIAGGYVFLTDLASLGFGTTALPGLAICDPAHGGYVNYIIAHLIALGVGLVLTVLFGKVTAKKNAASAAAQ